MQTNNKTSLARFNKRREMKRGLEIGFDHMLPSEVGESTKILEVLCNVLFCLNAPRGGIFVDYTLASALVRLEVGLVGFGGLTGSDGLVGLGGGLVGLTVVVGGLAGLTVVTVVVMVAGGLVTGLEAEAGLVGGEVALPGVTGLAEFAGAGLVGLAGFAGAVLAGLVGLAGLERLVVLVSTCCSGPLT